MQARVDPKSTTIGSPIRYTVEIDAPKDVELVIPLLGEKFGDFLVTDFGDEPSKEENGRLRVVRWFTLVAYEAGDHTLPAYPLKFRTSKEATELEDAQSNEVTVVVDSLLPKAPTPIEIRDIAEPEAPPFNWTPVWIGIAVVGGMAALVGLLLWFVERRRTVAQVPRPKPHEVALAALRRLQARHLLEAGQFESYYVELSAIVRAYVEGRFGLHAPEMTTEEFLVVMQRDHRLTGEHRALLGEFLGESDLVKFARYQPRPEDGERAWSAAERFVDESREREAAPHQGEGA